MSQRQCINCRWHRLRGGLEVQEILGEMEGTTKNRRKSVRETTNSREDGIERIHPL